MKKPERLYHEFLFYIDLMNEKYEGFTSFVFQLAFMLSFTTVTSKLVYNIAPLPLAELMDMDLFYVFFAWMVYALMRAYWRFRK